MDNEKILQAILDKLDSLEHGQNEMRGDISALKDGQALLHKRVGILDDKINRLGNDMAELIFVVTTSTDEAINKIKKEKSS